MKWLTWNWTDILSQKDIKEINKIIKKHPVKIKDKPANSIKTSKVKFVLYGHLRSCLDKCLQEIYKSNEINFNNLNIYPYENDRHVHCNTYNKNSQYDWHIDANDQNDDWDIKYTVLINTSEKKYTGGKFKIFVNDKPKHFKYFDEPGSMIMFRSHILHKVTPVTSGERKTLTLFITGPGLK
tara:strand:+ start:2664 stop:3209 length:546 start_codon:yes stop_codon:yes gene_type:complete